MISFHVPEEKTKEVALAEFSVPHILRFPFTCVVSKVLTIFFLILQEEQICKCALYGTKRSIRRRFLTGNHINDMIRSKPCCHCQRTRSLISIVMLTRRSIVFLVSQQQSILLILQA